MCSIFFMLVRELDAPMTVMSLATVPTGLRIDQTTSDDLSVRRCAIGHARQCGMAEEPQFHEGSRIKEAVDSLSCVELAFRFSGLQLLRSTHGHLMPLLFLEKLHFFAVVHACRPLPS